MNEKQFKVFFKRMLSKGFVRFVRKADGTKSFAVNSIFPGWFDLQFAGGRETEEEKEFARRADNLFLSWKKLNFFPLRSAHNLLHNYFSKPSRTIAAITSPGENGKSHRIEIQQKVEPPVTKIYPTEKVYELVDHYGKKGQIALWHCFCRQWRKMVGEPCRFEIPSETCLAVGAWAEHVIRNDFGKSISKDEALDILLKTRNQGALHMIFHEKENTTRPEMNICNCCWDCCGVIASYNRGISPLHFKCFYKANIPNDSLCNGCGICQRYCPTNALRVVNKKANIDAKKCIGCGQCAYQCSQEAIKLAYYERSVVLPLERIGNVRIPF